MIITQETLIRQVAKKEGCDVATVRRIYDSTEDLIFDHLSSLPPSEEIKIKLLSGLNIERKHVDSKKYTKGMFKNITCPSHVNVKPTVTKYFCKRVNDAFDKKH